MIGHHDVAPSYDHAWDPISLLCNRKLSHFNGWTLALHSMLSTIAWQPLCRVPDSACSWIQAPLVCRHTLNVKSRMLETLLRCWQLVASGRASCFAVDTIQCTGVLHKYTSVQAHTSLGVECRPRSFGAIETSVPWPASALTTDTAHLQLLTLTHFVKQSRSHTLISPPITVGSRACNNLRPNISTAKLRFQR